MSLYYVMRPDSVDEPCPVFTRYGKLGPNLNSALNRAKRCSGRVYETTGNANILKADFWCEPKPKPKLSRSEVRMRRAEVALFG